MEKIDTERNLLEILYPCPTRTVSGSTTLSAGTLVSERLANVYAY